MKKGLLLIVLAGIFLVSCGGGQEKEAAEAFCDCYKDMAEAKEVAANSTNTDTIFEYAEEMKEVGLKASKCRKGWDEKYNGKVDLKLFQEEVKKKNNAVYSMAVKDGAFKE
jgi:hypothetical protein|tara:strand:+ start:9375 stop:9707 length:333 start_codon:yes stop_codon:yes gene_type:complete